MLAFFYFLFFKIKSIEKIFICRFQITIFRKKNATSLNTFDSQNI